MTTIRRSYLLAGASALLFGAVHAIGGFQAFGVEPRLAAASSVRVFAQETPDAAMLLQTKCTTCHDLTNVEGGRGVNTEEQWRTIITRMTGYGAVLTEEETATLMTYLMTAPDPAP